MNQSNNDDRKEDQPIYSRLFVVCSKQTKEQELRNAFEEHGIVEDLFMPRNRITGEPKGVAFIKYSKTSSAAAAIKALHMTSINNKTLKVMVAASKSDPQGTDQYGDKYTRLFIKIPKDAQEKDLNDYFSQFGEIISVYIITDKTTGNNKGFAYIKFAEFYDAAKAFEECDKSYKPIFAAPKELKRARSHLDNDSLHSGHHSNNYEYPGYNQPNFQSQKTDFAPFLRRDDQDFKTVLVNCSPILPEKYIMQLMNIIPGMVNCHYSADTYKGICKAQVTYEDSKFASYAVEKLNKYEFPSGEIISVKPDANPLQKAATNLSDIVKNFKNSTESGAGLLHLADAIEKASSLIKAAAIGHLEPTEDTKASYCNVPLPPPKPVSNSARVVKRLFIVCKPEPPPQHILQDAFCRFGDFISVSTIPNKTFGFVKYASNSAAWEAMRVLNGTTLCGMRLRVLEADEQSTSGDRSENYTDPNPDPKRIKYEYDLTM